MAAGYGDLAAGKTPGTVGARETHEGDIGQLMKGIGQGLAAATMMLVTVVIIIIPWAYLEFGGKGRRT